MSQAISNVRSAQIASDLVDRGVLKTVDGPPSPAPRPPVRESDIGPLLDDLRRVRDEKDGLNERLSALSKQEAAIKGKLLDYHEASGLNSLGNDSLTVWFNHDLRARVDPQHWEGFFKWAVESGNVHVCYRQVSNTKLVELMNSGVAMPEGVTVETFVDINIRRKNGGGKAAK